VSKNLVLLGMMGVGKSTLAKIVAKKLDMELINIDKNIEKKNSMNIKEIFTKKGEDFFRIEEEKEVLKSLKKNNCLIDLGGGAFMNEKIRDNVLKNAISVWLDVNISTITKRVSWSQRRPLLEKGNAKKIMQELYDKRKKIYKLANHKIVCDKIEKENLAKKIITIYEKY
tara:strand:- start:359 stop:868 length:510 start_codon:yes stop_codon:yes gene_type:complete